jgi:hypothetical protein
MRLARVVPALAGHPELRSYACRPGGDAVTVDSPLAWRMWARGLTRRLSPA